MSILILGFYTGSLTSLILAPPFSEKPIDSADDLFRSGRTWMTFSGSLYARSLDSFPELQDRYRAIPNDPNSFTLYSKMLDKPRQLTALGDVQNDIIVAFRYYLDPEKLVQDTIPNINQSYQ